jgi:hypothetical protein
MDEICQPHSEQQAAAVKAFEEKHGYPLSSREPVPPRQLEQELTVIVLPFVRKTISEMKHLNASPRQSPTLAAFIAALEHGVAYSEKHQSWVVPGSTEEPFRRARELSWKLGTALCGQA